jgi:hypothetical protein
MEAHLAMSSLIGTRTAGDGKHGISAIVIKWPFDSNLAAGENDSPETLPYAIGGVSDGPRTLTIVNADSLLVGGIKDGVMESQHISQSVRARSTVFEIANGIRLGMFDNMNIDAIISTCMGDRKQVVIHHKHDSDEYEGDSRDYHSGK